MEITTLLSESILPAVRKPGHTSSGLLVRTVLLAFMPTRARRLLWDIRRGPYRVRSAMVMRTLSLENIMRTAPRPGQHSSHQWGQSLTRLRGLPSTGIYLSWGVLAGLSQD